MALVLEFGGSLSVVLLKLIVRVLSSQIAQSEVLVVALLIVNWPELSCVEPDRRVFETLWGGFLLFRGV